jgi:hypothetical protein
MELFSLSFIQDLHNSEWYADFYKYHMKLSFTFMFTLDSYFGVGSLSVISCNHKGHGENRSGNTDLNYTGQQSMCNLCDMASVHYIELFKYKYSLLIQYNTTIVNIFAFFNQLTKHLTKWPTIWSKYG